MLNVSLVKCDKTLESPDPRHGGKLKSICFDLENEIFVFVAKFQYAEQCRIEREINDTWCHTIIKIQIHGAII